MFLSGPFCALEPGKCPKKDASVAHSRWGIWSSRPRPRNPAAEPTPQARTPHLRVLHGLCADGQGAKPLLQRRPQLSTSHAAVVARRHWAEDRRKPAWLPPLQAAWTLERKCPEGATLPEAGSCSPPRPSCRRRALWKAAAGTPLLDLRRSSSRVPHEEGTCIFIAFPNPFSGSLDAAYLSFKQNQDHLAKLSVESFGGDQDRM